MEPFELRLQQVTFDSNSGTEADSKQTDEQPLDSFDALVHYDACFHANTAPSESGDGPAIRDFAYTGKIKSTATKTTVTYSSSPGHQSANSGYQRANWSSPQSQSHSQSQRSPWEVHYAGDNPQQELFLINPHDYFAPSTPAGKVSPESAAAGLRTLSQVSVNTAAVAKHLRKSAGSKRRVAKTTLTTTALVAPYTMPSETKPPSGATSPSTPGTGPEGAVGQEGEEKDSSFETVAEALRLQWSVIGNSSVTPVSPEEVAKIVAEAQMRLRGEMGIDTTSPVPLPDASAANLPTTAQLPIAAGGGSVTAQLPRATEGQIVGGGVGLGGGSVGESRSPPHFSTDSGPHFSRDRGSPRYPGEGVSRQADSLTREPERSLWLQSKGIEQQSNVGQTSTVTGVRGQGVVHAGPPSFEDARGQDSYGGRITQGQDGFAARSMHGQDGYSSRNMQGKDSYDGTGGVQGAQSLSSYFTSPEEQEKEKRQGSQQTPSADSLPAGHQAGRSTALPPAPSSTPSWISETQNVPYRSGEGTSPFPQPQSQQTQAAPQYELFRTEDSLQSAGDSLQQAFQELTTSPPQQSAESSERKELHSAEKDSQNPSQQNAAAFSPQQSLFPDSHATTSPAPYLPRHPDFTSTSLPQSVNYTSPVRTSSPMTNFPPIGPLFPAKKPGSPSPQTHRQVLESTGGRMSPGRAVLGGVSRDDFEKLLREKLKLEGQLEVLQDEAQTTLQQRAELQAQLASLQLKMKSSQQKTDDAEKASLRVELERLRSTRMEHEREAQEVQQMLEEKMEELKTVTEDLYQSQDTVDKLQVRMKELRDDLQAREVTIQALKSKIAELYVDVQTTLQSKMDADSEARTARNDLESLVKAKEWYQEQLSTAHEVRAKLQWQLTQLQAQTDSQGTIVERLKMESARLRQQLRESQERALREKEQLARHLETIQNDMMEREAAFQEIQRERLMIEDTFNTQVSTVEEEKSRISSLLQLTSDLESQLEAAHSSSKKKQEQVFALENEQMDLMKKLTLAQEALVEKEQSLEEVNQKLIEVESQLEGYVKMLAVKDAELLKLREDKAATEIALKAALQEKESVDKALDMLKADMGKVEKSFKQMRQELGTRSVELETAQGQQKAARDELDRVAHELDIKSRSVESLTHEREEHMAQIESLQANKAALEQQISQLKGQIDQAKSAAATANEAEQQALQTELQQTRAQLMEAETRLQTTTLQLQQSSASSPQADAAVSDEKYQEIVAENDSLKNQLSVVKQDQLALDKKLKQEKEERGNEVAALKAQLSEGRSEFEQSVASYVQQIRQAVEEKQRLETELEMRQRKYELSSVQQQEQIHSELQNLMSELEAARLQKQELERQLMVLQAEKDAEIHSLRQQLADTQEALQDLTQKLDQQTDTDRINQELALELEKERGRIAGLQQSNSNLKEHMQQLEEALAGRESSLVEVNSHLQTMARERESEQQDYLRRIQTLELALQKEKDGGRDLRKQIGSKMTENKRLGKQQETLKKERTNLQEEVERRQADNARLQSDLDAARQAVRGHQVELQSLQAEKHVLETELERVKRELADNADRNPVLLEQIQNLEWQLSQRLREVEAVREQLALAEQRQAAEMDSLRQALQDKQAELEGLQAELSAARQEKAEQKSRVSELRSVLKASVQHHKLTKKLNTKKREQSSEDGTEEKGTQADFGNGVIIPPLPFDMEAVEKLLQDTAVKPLDSKPLDNLSNCLSSLRAEISGLQKQMDAHTTTIHTSTQSWKSVESEVKGLQEVVRSIANTIMEAAHTSTFTTTTAADTEQVQDSDIIQI